MSSAPSKVGRRSNADRRPIGRRQMLAGAGAAMLVGALQGCSVQTLGSRPNESPRLQLATLQATTDRITAITVCTRPFRTQGPRLEVERVGEKTVVHNYGHGGSGWSLSWGSGAIAVDKAMATGEREIAVIGCGALGLTSALLLQRAGARVTIHARELPPNVRSSLATGLWTPDSRICFEDNATPAFKQMWESMARKSFQTYQTLLGLPANPVEYVDMYGVDNARAEAQAAQAPGDARPQFAELQEELIPDLIPQAQAFEPGSHSLGARYLRRNTNMMFNLSAYQRLLMDDFLLNGGKIEIREFHTPSDFASLREKTVIHATGYGARALFSDQSVVPVRGQLARMIPQADIRYGLRYEHVSFVPRRDGMVFQVLGEDDYYGYGNDTAVPDRAEAEHAVNTIAGLFAG